MATITYDSDAPGRGGSGPLFSGGSRPMKIVTGTFDFDTSYPTGGEDISEIFNQFLDSSGVSRLSGVVFSLTGALVTIDTKVITQARVDYSAKKLLLIGEDTTSGIPAQVSNAVNASTVTGLRFIAWGPRK